MSDYKSILIIDHDENYSNQLKKELEKEQFIVEVLKDGEKGLLYMLQNEFDLAIMELRLPGINGLDLCKLVRQIKTTPIIMLTVEGKEEHRLEGFQIGIDDYIVKPSNPTEIIHRTKAVLRRSLSEVYSSKEISVNQLVFPHFVIDWDNYRISTDGRHVYLTKRERDLLHFLLNRPDVIFTREELLKEIWNNEAGIEARTVDTSIKRIRDKLNKAYPKAASMIKTVWGIGYIVKVIN